MEVLKPCPFCGNEVALFVNNGIRVLCPKCGATSQTARDEFGSHGAAGSAVERVIAAWNQRVNEKEE